MMLKAIHSWQRTHRGDLHLTLGTPSLLARYEAATDEGSLRRLVIDREGMATEFLAKLAAEGRAEVAILHTGCKRGQVVRTRTVTSRAHSFQWLGSFDNRATGGIGRNSVKAS
jgi:hypothetical protein